MPSTTGPGGSGAGAAPAASPWAPSPPAFGWAAPPPPAPTFSTSASPAVWAATERKEERAAAERVDQSSPGAAARTTITDESVVYGLVVAVFVHAAARLQPGVLHPGVVVLLVVVLAQQRLPHLALAALERVLLLLPLHPLPDLLSGELVLGHPERRTAALGSRLIHGRDVFKPLDLEPLLEVLLGEVEAHHHAPTRRAAPLANCVPVFFFSPAVAKKLSRAYT